MGHHVAVDRDPVTHDPGPSSAAPPDRGCHDPVSATSAQTVELRWYPQDA
ncbi:hypothetical protein [Streptomyces globisporus]|nr:hypothetical protein [Streptomyces globisporus]